MTGIEQAQVQDAPVLADLVNYYAARNVMLYRDEQSIRDSLDRWVVAVSMPTGPDCPAARSWEGLRSRTLRQSWRRCDRWS